MDRNHPLEIVEDIETFASNLNPEMEMFYNLINDVRITFYRISDEGLKMFGGHIFLLHGNIEMCQ